MGDHAFEQRPRRDDVAGAKRRREDFRKRPGVRHDAEPIGARQRQNGRTVVVKLVVVVFFDDRELVLARELEQPEAPRRRQSHSGRELMMGCHVQCAQLSVRRNLFDRFDLDAVLVERDRNQLRAVHAEDFHRRAIGELFDRHDVAGSHQRLCKQRQRHLTPTRDADIVGSRRDSARRRQHRGDGRAKPLVSLWPPIPEDLGSAANGAAVRAADQIGRNQPDVGPIRREQKSALRDVVRHFSGRRRRKIDVNVTRDSWSWNDRDVRQIGRHERAARRTRDDPSFRGQLIECGHDRQALHIE